MIDLPLPRDDDTQHERAAARLPSFHAEQDHGMTGAVWLRRDFGVDERHVNGTAMAGLFVFAQLR